SWSVMATAAVLLGCVGSPPAGEEPGVARQADHGHGHGEGGDDGSVSQGGASSEAGGSGSSTGAGSGGSGSGGAGDPPPTIVKRFSISGNTNGGEDSVDCNTSPLFCKNHPGTKKNPCSGACVDV